MKVYDCPKECPWVPDYTSLDFAAEEKREKEHSTRLKTWLLEHGYTGKYTGSMVHFGVADGSAQYMIADGKSFCLIHLPYGDAYQYRDIKFLPKREIIKRIFTIDS
jgi:hypothetical protein